LKHLPAIKLQHLKSNEPIHYGDHKLNIVIKGACGICFL